MKIRTRMRKNVNTLPETLMKTEYEALTYEEERSISIIKAAIIKFFLLTTKPQNDRNGS